MVVLGLLALCSVGTADELLVPSEYPTIQSAIDDANEGDTVLVADGVYTGQGDRDIDFLGKAVTVQSENGPNNCIIDCNGTEAERHRGFYFHSGEDANSILDGFTITNGFAKYGGGIYCEGSNPTLTNCTFSGNSGYRGGGGGISNHESSPTLTNCTFSGNKAYYDGGGGMYNFFNSNPTITNCTFSGNSAHWSGGGMYNLDDSSPTITNCTFSGNSAYWSGGGMFNSYSSSPTITNCTFSGNWAEFNGGGGMLNYKRSSPTITNCTFSDNSAEKRGGGLLNYDESSPTLTNCTFSGNWDRYGGGGMHNFNRSSPTLTNCTFSRNWADSGGGIRNYKSDPNITNCTFWENSSSSAGGGMFNDRSNPTLTNCILWGNTAPSGAQIYNHGTSSSAVTFSDVQGGWLGTGNIDEDPCFVDPGYWDANGTPADADDDFWVDGDYHLKSEGWRWDRDANQWTWDDVTSRCIDAGNPGSPLGDEPLTLEVDPLNRWGENLRINMGAFGGTAEASMPPYDWAILGDLTNNGLVNLKDYAFQTADWRNSADQQPSDLNRDSLVDISDVALLVEDWLRQTTWHE